MNRAKMQVGGEYAYRENLSRAEAHVKITSLTEERQLGGGRIARNGIRIEYLTAWDAPFTGRSKKVGDTDIVFDSQAGRMFQPWAEYALDMAATAAIRAVDTENRRRENANACALSDALGVEPNHWSRSVAITPKDFAAVAQRLGITLPAPTEALPYEA